MKAARLPTDPGPAAWNEILPTNVLQPALEDARTADWLVIGAGFAGLAAAKRLKELRPKDKIAVLEACQIASGPAGRNSGFMIDLPHDLASDDYAGQVASDLKETKINREGIAFATKIASEFSLSREAFNESGKINGAISQKGHHHNLDYHAHLNSMNEPSELLDTIQMRDITGSLVFQNGLFTPGTVVIQPALYIRNLSDGLIKQGVKVFENSPVIELSKANGNWVAVTPNGRIETPKVILAVNGHLNSFGFKKNRLMHIFTYASMTRKIGKDDLAKLGGETAWGLTPADPMGSTVRRIAGTSGDRLVIRNRFTFDSKMEVSQTRLNRVARDHRKSFDFRFPQLKDMEMEFTWGGRLCLSLNNVPILEELEENLFATGCQNGLGTAKGTYGGKIAAELATGYDKNTPEFDEPKKLPPEPIASIGANLTIRWKERLAGKEL